MLLVHQAGSVKIGEVIRYTLTYTPSSDRILPSPSELHVRIKNTSAIPLRAAYLHGPYTLHVSAYPSTFNPNKKLENIKKYGVPEFEPNLKAGGNWTTTLRVPEDIRESGDRTRHHDEKAPEKVTWIIELSSQILFSNTASVHYELLVGRDERSLDVGFAAVAGKGHGEPGHITDFQQRTLTDSSTRMGLPKGIYSRAVELVVEDTAALWNKPALPKWEGEAANVLGEKDVPIRKKERKKIHLVILTHGLHSNVGADMLYMKESIDAAAKQARRESRARKKGGGDKKDSNKREKDSDHAHNHQPVAPANLAGGQEELEDEQDEEDSDDEQVIVRGFSGNAVRTERGIQYLGKRLAKFVLTMTYPTQPYLPPSKSLSRKLTGNLGKSNANTPTTSRYGEDNAAGTIPGGDGRKSEDLPWVITSISFIGHSLGGLVQTYAIAYIHKHSPEFFSRINPINFVAMASPMLGLSNENPLYVKFALDFGLVGRTGQDLGLTWRAPALARSGWSAVISGFGGGHKEEHEKQPDPRTKPLLRILPTGPAHEVLKMFRNRTLYSNVVNDGIVPLPTSCLLFLDWRGLEKVEGARRENGLITTMASFGWAELTGANSNSHRPNTARLQDELDTPDESGDEKASKSKVPQPSRNATKDDNDGGTPSEPEPHQFLNPHQAEHSDTTRSSPKQGSMLMSPITDILNIFRPHTSNKPPKISKKYTRTIQRAQTIKPEPDPNHSTNSDADDSHSPTTAKRAPATRGDSLTSDTTANLPPPKTSVFEAAGDLISPPLPPEPWLIDPSKRARTIFHDRIYHPSDIPPPPSRRPRFGRSFSSNESLRSPSTPIGSTNSTLYDNSSDGGLTADFATGMKVAEKIARAYHRDLSWRKVLVRLEPDAHNNMVVRRMFANAYGWDVIKHLCDTHFSDNAATSKPDAQESNRENAKSADEPVGEEGGQVKSDAQHEHDDDDADDEHEHDDTTTATTTQTPKSGRPNLPRTPSERHEARDSLTPLNTQTTGISALASHTHGPSPLTPHHLRRTLVREDSALWSDAVFDDTEGDSEDDVERQVARQSEKREGAEEPADVFERIRRLWNGTASEDRREGGGSGSPAAGREIRPRPLPRRSQTHTQGLS